MSTMYFNTFPLRIFKTRITLKNLTIKLSLILHLCTHILFLVFYEHKKFHEIQIVYYL